MSTRARPAPPPAPHRRPSAGRPAPLLGTLAKKTFPSPPLLPSLPPVAPFLPRSRSCLPAMLAAKRQDGGLFKGPPYPGYPFIMIPDLSSPYLPNGSLSPTARTVSAFFSPLLFPLPPRSLPGSRRCRAPGAPLAPALPPPPPPRRKLSKLRGPRREGVCLHFAIFLFFFFKNSLLFLFFCVFFFFVIIVVVFFLLSVLWAVFLEPS